MLLTECSVDAAAGDAGDGDDDGDGGWRGEGAPSRAAVIRRPSILVGVSSARLHAVWTSGRLVSVFFKFVHQKKSTLKL